MLDLIQTMVDFANGINPEEHLRCITDAGGLVLGIFGIFMAFRAKRTAKFRVKLAGVFLLPMICSLGSLHPSLQPTEFYLRAYMSTFVVLLTLLYWREVGYLSASIREHKEAFSGLLRAIPDMVWMKDPDGRYQFTDEEVTHSIILCDPSEVLGRTDDEIAQTCRSAGNEFPVPGIFDSCTWVNRDGEIVCTKCRDTDLLLKVYRVPIHVVDRVTGQKRLWGVVGIGQNVTGYLDPDSPEVTRHLQGGSIKPKK